MTRINAFINPLALSDQHLLAEIKEINQLCGQYAKSTDKTVTQKLFGLGSGHVRFFYNKGVFLFERFEACKAEALTRGFNVSAEFNFSVWRKEDLNVWEPGASHQRITKGLLMIRIRENLSKQKVPIRYYREPVGKEFIKTFNKLA